VKPGENGTVAAPTPEGLNIERAALPHDFYCGVGMGAFQKKGNLVKLNLKLPRNYVFLKCIPPQRL
jgi:hypothetical protein